MSKTILVINDDADECARLYNGCELDIVEKFENYSVVKPAKQDYPIFKVWNEWLEEVVDDSPFEKWHSGWQIPSIELRGDRNYLIPIIPEKIKLLRMQGWNGALDYLLSNEVFNKMIHSTQPADSYINFIEKLKEK